MGTTKFFLPERCPHFRSRLVPPPIFKFVPAPLLTERDDRILVINSGWQIYAEIYITFDSDSRIFEPTRSVSVSLLATQQYSYRLIEIHIITSCSHTLVWSLKHSSYTVQTGVCFEENFQICQQPSSS